MKNLRIYLSLLLVAFSISVFGNRPKPTTSNDVPLALNALFSNYMVLQQNTQAPIWGTGIPGTTITISASWGKTVSTTVGNDSKWKAKISTPIAVAGEKPEYNLSITDETNTVTIQHVMVGEVWICSGQSNMVFRMSPTYDRNGKIKTVGVVDYEREIANANFNHIRYFYQKAVISTTPVDDCVGTWKTVEPGNITKEKKHLFAVAYYFARELQKEENLNIPIGLLQAAVGATGAQIWTSREYLSADQDLKTRYLDPSDAQDKLPKSEVSMKGGAYAAKRYNAMIYPMAPYAIKGAIWYQGESNRFDYDIYAKLHSDMIKCWRELWQQGDFPFYYVQIAPWTNLGLNRHKTPAISGLLREAQEKVQHLVPNTGMVTTIDLGDQKDIHPPCKLEVGERLAWLALKKTYNKDLSFTGPTLTAYNIEGNKIRLYFDKDGIGNGLDSSVKLNHFKIAGKDNVYKDAEAIIDGNTVLVWSPTVKKPKNALYAFDNALVPAPNFKNLEGIAAFPFRTVNIGTPSIPVVTKKNNSLK